MDRSKLDEFSGCSHDVLHRNDQVTLHSLPFCTQDNWQSSVLVLSQVRSCQWSENINSKSHWHYGIPTGGAQWVL